MLWRGRCCSVDSRVVCVCGRKCEMWDQCSEDDIFCRYFARISFGFKFRHRFAHHVSHVICVHPGKKVFSIIIYSFSYRHRITYFPVHQNNLISQRFHRFLHARQYVSVSIACTCQRLNIMQKQNSNRSTVWIEWETWFSPSQSHQSASLAPSLSFAG